MRHLNGENNFVNRGKPTGWKGSDIIDHKIGIDYLKHKKSIFNFSLGLQESGSENITTKKYDPISSYSYNSFPSKSVIKTNYVDMEYHFKFADKYFINFYIFYPFYKDKFLYPIYNFSFNIKHI